VRPGRHTRLLVIATCVWAGFWVAGLPSYYQQYSDRSMVVFSVLLLVAIAAVVHRIFRGVSRQRRLTVSAWFAFYFTVPLALYDWLYCGVYLGHGLAFLTRYWYLSIYYLIPWVLMPAIALWLNRAEEGRSGEGRTQGGPRDAAG
jgi:hypothetical protein